MFYYNRFGEILNSQKPSVEVRIGIQKRKARHLRNQY